MANYASKKIINAIVIMFVISLITFFVLKIIPGDPALIILGTDATTENLNKLRESMGLNAPLSSQYLNWITNALNGDLGKSYYYGEDVRLLITQRLPVTFTLAVISISISFVLALILGVFAAIYKDSWINYITRTVIALGSSIPNFWLGMICMFFFASYLKLFPVTGFVEMKEGFWKSIHSLLLPSLVIATGELSILVRITRSSMLSALENEYMISTEVKGLKRSMAIVKYALRSAIISPITVVGLQFAKLFGSTAIIETVFSLPGLDRLLVVSVEQRDLMLLQGIVLFITAVVVIISFFTDIIFKKINSTIDL